MEQEDADANEERGKPAAGAYVFAEEVFGHDRVANVGERTGGGGDERDRRGRGEGVKKRKEAERHGANAEGETGLGDDGADGTAKAPGGADLVEVANVAHCVRGEDIAGLQR